MRLKILLILLMLVPPLAFAQRTSYDVVAPNGVVHVEEYDVDGHREMHCAIASDEGLADLTYDGRAIRFGDGYAIEFTTLVRTPAVFVLRLVATAPHGPSSTAILARSMSTGETTHAGLDGFTAAMRRSRHAQIAARVLTELQSEPADGRKWQIDPLNRLSFRIAPNDCLTDAYALVVAAAGILTYCDNPVTGLQCFVSVGGFLGAAYSMWRDCPDNQYADGTIGWGP